MSENLEFQRYGRNKSTLVNSTYISSGEYRNKFDKITDNKDVNRVLYIKAKEMLLHRSGTLYEDMYWFDADTGQVIAKEVNSFEEEQILYSESIKRAIEGKNMLGIVLCHDGKIFCYKSDETITKMMYNLYVADYYLQLHDEYLAQIEALKELSETYDIEFWEVQ